jgi:hypothetical protein
MMPLLGKKCDKCSRVYGQRSNVCEYWDERRAERRASGSVAGVPGCKLNKLSLMTWWGLGR